MRKMVRSTALSIAVATLLWSGSVNAATLTNWQDVQPPIIPGLDLSQAGDPDANLRFFGWDNVTNNRPDLHNYLDFGLVMYEDGGNLRFAFLNWVAENEDGPIYSSITDIYFDDHGAANALSSVSIVADSTGPNFVQGVNPTTLPGGESLSPDFIVNPLLSAQSTKVNTSNGSGGPGLGVESLPEWVVLGYSYLNGNTFGSIATALENGDIRIGMHVTGFVPGGDSESFIWTPLDPGELPGGPGPLDPGDTPVVPVPAAAGLGFLGMVLVGIVRRKKS